MIHRLTHDVWFGDGHSPFEAINEEPPVGTIINVAHHLRDRFDYFPRLRQIRHYVLYIRHALRDREDATPPYLDALATFADHAVRLGKLPILCHCQMGGHRGPSAALFVVWHLGQRGRTLIETYHAAILRAVPRFAPGNRYRQSVMAYMEAHSCD